MIIDDVRHALRRILSRPATIATAAAMLGLGIGLTTAMFTIADSLMLRPVPFEAADRLTGLALFSDRGGAYAVSVPVLKAWRNSRAFDRVEAANEIPMLIETRAGPVARNGALVTPGAFDMLGARPLVGRTFQPGDGRAGADDRVVISEDVWRGLFGADPAVIGSRVTINGEPLTVVGVVPSEFRFPKWDTQVWQPIDYELPPPARASTKPIATVRFSAAMPQDDALRLATDAAHQADAATADLTATLRPIGGFRFDEYYKTAVPVLFAGVGLVFIVLCANVGSLLLVRFGARRREFGLCSALGASRMRLLRQAVLESAILGVVGVAVGVALAWVLVSAARALLPESFLLLSLNPLDLDVRALGAACVFGALGTAAAGIPPAWIGTRMSPSNSLQLAGRGGTESRASRAVTRGLLVVEIALACTLLVASTMLVRSFVNLSMADRGLNTSGVVTASISLPEAAFPDEAARSAMRRAVEDEMRSLPGVTRVALTFGLPPDGGYIHFGDWQSDAPGAEPRSLMLYSYDVGADYFDLYGISILRGRSFLESDTRDDVVIGERLARALWPDADPIGRTFNSDNSRYRVIGLARETNFPSVDARVDLPEFYRPLRAPGGYFMLSLRCHDDCPSPAIVRQRLLRLSAGISVVDVGPLEAKFLEQIVQPRAAAALASAFAVIAVLAAAGGLFSVLSFAVARRRREFGIRAALGASAGQLRGLVLRDGLVIAVVGLAAGSGTAWLFARSLSAVQYGVTESDPISWFGVVAVLGTTTLLASWRPARSATRVDPVELLRED